MARRTRLPQMRNPNHQAPDSWFWDEEDLESTIQEKCCDFRRRGILIIKRWLFEAGIIEEAGISAELGTSNAFERQ